MPVSQDKALLTALACTATTWMKPDHDCDASTNVNGTDKRQGREGRRGETSMTHGSRCQYFFYFS